MREDNQATDRLFTEPLATILADKRRRARQKGCRLLYDCRYNEVIADGRVSCRRGHILGRANDGTLSLVEVLKGITPAVCKKCGDYWGWEGENKAGE